MRWPVEFPVERWPRLRRPEDWQPLAGERVLFVQGGGYPVITVRIHRPDAEPGRDRCGWGCFIAELSRDRLFPYPDWREARERCAREGEEERGSGGDGEIEF